MSAISSAPDFRAMPIMRFLYGWPALLFISSYLSYFCYSSFQLLRAPFATPKEGLVTSLESWYFPTVFLPLGLQVGVLSLYFTWIGWKFFQHN